ncbi:MAG TPA: FecR family protein, partial [Candidatus Sulfotelmatobacter sp.]|nr:FecR family protein [Candidatus Sulfotelmatobacter sp.]
MRHGRILAVLMFAVTMTVTGAWAQEYPQGPNGEAAPASDGPQPDVARISLIHGDVSTQRGDTGDWAVTSINAPLVGGDQVATGEKSRAEIQLDYANLVRLAAGSQVKIADLSRTRIQLQVAQGYANFTQLKGSEAEVEIDSPNVAVRPLKHGRYRVQVASDSETDVIVREGEAEITTPQGSTRVKEGQMIQVRGTDNPEYRVAEAPAKDDWDRWNKDRDATIRDAHSWGQTNRYYTGVHDLDSYGHWVYVPGYGQVWRPYYSNAGWAPYQSGRWVWEPYYGWTWVSYEPWGWAPYHYGRWLYYSGNWCWWPGPVYVHYRPVWSPAFVFFVGFGHHSSFGFGNIGWFPVGPHDAYYPWYGRGFNRVNVVNVTNINVINVRNGPYIAPLAVRGRHPYYSNVNLVQNNVHVRGAITSVGVEDFGHGNFNNRHHGVQDHEWREARVMTANLPVVPSREHLHVSGGEAHLPVGMQPRNN